MVILGVDPGLSGALSYVDGSFVRIYDMPVLNLGRGGKDKREPDWREFARIIRDVEVRPDFVVVENVGPMPQQGASSTFVFGKMVGGIHAALAAMDLRMELVAPAKWKRFHNITSGSGKDASRFIAKNLFPQQASLFARVKDDGRAEATLMAFWGRQNIHTEIAA